MAWEWRKSGVYYYQKQRNGQQVTSRYVGTADTAAYSATIDQAEREARATAQARIAAQRVTERQHDHAITTALRQVRTLVADVLTQIGYHQHKRQWRKHRMALTTEESALMERCQKPTPDPNDLRALHKLFSAYPDRFRGITNLLEHAEMRIIEGAGGSPFIRETLRAGVVRLQLDLGYDESPAMERLLIDAVAVTWLRYALMEQQYSLVLDQSHSLAMAQHWERRLSAAQSRYLRAVESLARVRRLAVPALIQNIAAHQTVQIGG